MAWAFLLGMTNDKDLQTKLEEENLQNKDVLQFSIVDKYENLSFKTLSAYLWNWRKYKSGFDWIIKMDDDIDVKLNKILTKLEDYQ